MTHERNDEPAQDRNAQLMAAQAEGSEARAARGGFGLAPSVDDRPEQPIAPRVPVPYDHETGRWADDLPAPGSEVFRTYEGYDELSVQMDQFSFSGALEALKQGLRVQRAGWNGKGMFLFLAPNATCVLNDRREPLDPHIVMSTVTGSLVPWLASQTDILATDWQIV